MGFFTGRAVLLRRIVVALGSAVGLLLVLGAVFALRAPVILVSDAPFAILYGRQRGLLKQAELSLRLFRPVKVALVAENAGPDMVAFAVEESSKSPHAALFPYRYYEGARRCGEKFPSLRILVFAARGAPVREGDLLVRADVREDYRRAALAAALFARKSPGKLLFFQDDTVSPAAKEAFLAALREGGLEEAPLFLENGADYGPWQDVSCAVVSGQPPAFLDRNLKVPVILFSWIDPALTPAAVKVIFDDSPWALAFQALGQAGRKGEGRPVVSGMAFFPERIGDAELVRALKKTVRGVL